MIGSKGPWKCLKYLKDRELSSVELTFQDAKDSEKDQILESINKTINCFDKNETPFMVQGCQWLASFGHRFDDKHFNFKRCLAKYGIILTNNFVQSQYDDPFMSYYNDILKSNEM